jgi:hypothetical protein
VILLGSTLIALATASFTRLDRRAERKQALSLELERRAQQIVEAVVALADASENLEHLGSPRLELRAAISGLASVNFPAVEDLLSENDSEKIAKKAQDAVNAVGSLMHAQLQRLAEERSATSGRLTPADAAR